MHSPATATEPLSRATDVEPPVRVSVCMITYNHERFIAEALDSVFAQKTFFNYEIVIGVDYSSDRTRDIVEDYVTKYPEKIKPLYYTENVGLKRNFVETLGRCQGEFVAVLSGDDFWTEPSKLQKQVEFLEAEKRYVLIGHNALGLSETRDREPSAVRKERVGLDVDTAALMLSNPFVASMVMFRNIVQEFPDVYYASIGEDRRLYLLLSLRGKCRFEPAVVGVYRSHSTSITGKRRASYEGRKGMLLESIRNAERWNEYLGDKYCEEVELVRERSSRALVLMALHHKDIKAALEYCEAIDPAQLRTSKSKIAVAVLKILKRTTNKFGLKPRVPRELET